MHPTLRIVLYVLAALALPGLSFFQLLAFGALVLAAFHNHLVGARRLLWRARWLFLLLGIGYAYSLPGPVGIDVLGVYSPSRPGLWLGATQMLRLFLLLWLLDGLVVSMGEGKLMSGLYGLFSLFKRFGFPVEQSTVRLGLTLQAMEGNLGRRRSLREAMADLSASSDAATHFALHLQPWRTLDSLLLFGAVALLVVVWHG